MSTKIKTIRVENYKAVSSQEVNMDGASILMTAGNNKGKSSVLKGLVERFQGVKTPVTVKEGEDKGFSEMELTDGSIIRWKFTDKSEQFTFTTKGGITQSTGVLTAIGERYFGKRFNIDEFISMSSVKQTEKVLEILGVDTSKLDADYKAEYELRTDANREVKRLLALNKQKPEFVEKPNIEEVKLRKQSVIDTNSKIESDWLKDNEEHQNSIVDFNREQQKLLNEQNNVSTVLEHLEKYKDSKIGGFIDYKGLYSFAESLPKPQPNKEILSLPRPTLNSLQEIDEELEKAYLDLEKFNSYETKLEEYNSWVKEGKIARDKAEEHDANLKAILEEKANLVANANMPKDFSISENNDLLYNGFPLNNSQISTSSKYIASLKLGSLVLGEVKSIHFDASFLDKKSLDEVIEWANRNDYQIMVERPEFEGSGDIQYRFLS